MDERVPENRDSHARSSHEASLVPTPARSADLDKHSVCTHFPKDRNCEICQRTKITRAPCRRRIGRVVPRAENWWFMTADHKVLSEGCESRNNHRYAVVVQDLATQWIQSYPCKTKTSQETQRSLQKFLEPNRKPKVICTDNSLEFWLSLGRSFLESLYVNTTQIRNKWDCWESSEQSKGRYLCCIVAIGSKWKLVGRFYGMLHLSAKHSISLVWWEDSIRKTLLRTFERTDYPVWFIGWELPSYCEGPVKNPSIWQESLTWIVPRIRSVRGGNLEGWHNSCRRWGAGNGGRIGNLLWRLNAKEVIFPKEKGKFIVPIADGRTQFVGGDQELRTSTLIRLNSRIRLKRFSGRIRRVSTTTTSRLTSGCLWSTKWFLVHFRKLHFPPSRWTQSQTLLAERGNIPYSTEIHWRIQNCADKLGCCARKPHRWLLEYRWMKRLVWFLDRFHPVYSIKWETSRRIYMVRGETDKTNGKQHPDQIIYAQNSGEECQERKAKGKA